MYPYLQIASVKLDFFVYTEIFVEKYKYNIKDRKKNFFVVKVMEARNSFHYR